MSFRKRNVGLSTGPPRTSDAVIGSAPSSSTPLPPSIPGVRPSPLDGRPTTSTGTPTLDGLLAGHTGLTLGASLLIEESGTTDFAGALLRYYAAEGVVQGHAIHVVGVGQQWGRDLPGLTGSAGEESMKEKRSDEKMKIAWRYERLGEFGSGIAGTRAKPQSASQIDPTSTAPTFCHTFDLTKRLTHPGLSTVNYIPITLSKPDASPYTSILQNLTLKLSESPPSTIHRILIPSLLSPALYPPQASLPTHLLQFLHSLRALMSTYGSRLSIMLSLPLSLYPRSTGLVRWIELLSDGVLELAPFPHSSELFPPTTTSGAATSQEEPPHGMLTVHRLPIFHDRGGAVAEGLTEDWAFTLSRRKFAIKPFSLPPLEGDSEAQRGDVGSAKNKKADMEF